MRILLIACIAIASACATPATRSTPTQLPLTLPFAPDTQRIERIADGVTRHFIYSSTGPWAVNVLEVDRNACYSGVAVKGFPGAAGRKRTSQLLSELDSSGLVIGGVNADFFSPNGTPTNAHVSRGRVVTGPNRQPVLAFDSGGRPHIAQFKAMTDFPGHGPMAAPGWNRPLANGFSRFDANWGTMTDSASNAVEVVFDSDSAGPFAVAVDTATSGVGIPPRGFVNVYRGSARSTSGVTSETFAGHIRERQYVLPSRHWLEPIHPLEAVGGRPILVANGAIPTGLDSAGGVAFASSRHPRTAVGIANNGNRLFLVTVDGRQKPYSDGMTLRELANLMLAIGARDAINLDGGGSTALVYKDPATKRLTIANKPSDPTGERAVGNALAIVRGCVRN